jgi:hypothetical protein
MRRATPGVLWLASWLAIVPAAGALPDEAPVVVTPHLASLAIAKISGTIYAAATASTQSRATQLVFGPGPVANQEYLYVSRDDHGVRRMDYDPVTGALSKLVDVLPSVVGHGIAFHTGELGQAETCPSEGYASANAPSKRLSRLPCDVDVDADGILGAAGDASAEIVHGFARDDHGLNQIQIHGDTLFVGNGVRTRNGAVQTFTGDTFSGSACVGTILTINDLNAVATTANAARLAAYLSDSTDAAYEDLSDATIPGSEETFTSTAAEGDALDGRSNDEVHDHVFRAVPFADYGYRNGNWQNDAGAQAAGFFSGSGNPALNAPTVAFGNLDQDGSGGIGLDSTEAAYDQLHDPACPVGLGPFSALTGLAFSPASFPAAYLGRVLVARWNGQSGILDGLDCRGLVLVDPATRDAERVVSGLNAPTDIVGDAHGCLLVVSSYGSIWRITPVAQPIPISTRGGHWTPLLLSPLQSTLFFATAVVLPRKSRSDA